jgi:hypothetical protein
MQGEGRMKLCGLKVNGCNLRHHVKLARFRKTKAACFLSYVEDSKDKLNMIIYKFVCRKSL